MTAEDWKAAHLRQRAWICGGMIIAGVMCLIAGGLMLLAGGGNPSNLWIETDQIKLTAQGFGAVTMGASVLWGFLAYFARPQVNYEDQFSRFTLAPSPSVAKTIELGTIAVVFLLGCVIGILGTLAFS